MSVLTSKNITFTPGNHRYHITDTKPKVYIPSVTTITGLLDKPFLVEWAAREAATAAVNATVQHEGGMDDDTIERLIDVGRKAHREKREEGANVGTAVHNEVKQILVPGWKPEEEVDGGIEAEMAMSAFSEWYDKHVEKEHNEVLLVERIVVHPHGTYVGTFDLLLRTPENKLRVVDWKTSNQSDSNPCALYPEYLLQIAAYREALIATPEYDDVIGDAVWGDAQVVALGKNGQLACTTLVEEQLDMYAEAFGHLATIIGTYRAAQGHIRAFNKEEKLRRADADFEAHVKESV